jgi:hypothetical protein
MRPLLAAAVLLPVTLIPAKAQTFSDNYASMWQWPFTPPTIQRSHTGRGSSSVSRACLTAQTRAVLAQVEARFGPVKVVSTCRRGAVIAGTRHPSMHRYGKAVDFEAPGRKAAIVQWLRANNSGLVMTYARSGHIHFDTGTYRSYVCAECGSRRVRRAYSAARR